MKKYVISAALSGALLLSSCTQLRKTGIDVELGNEFDGDTVALAVYDDSTVYATAVARDGKATFVLDRADTLGPETMSMVMVDGRAKGYFVLDPGADIVVSCTAGTARGSMNNDSLSAVRAMADSIDATGDTDAYSDFMLGRYVQAARSAPGVYYASECARFASLARIDSILATAPPGVRNSRRIARWRAAAALREKTSPGNPFIDFGAAQPDGRMLRLSDIAGKGRYVLVDFWASWCPWCIKELPGLKDLHAKYAPKGLDIIGVAVRDDESDTRAAVAKHGIPWRVMYNARRTPYDIYGFTGIPHLMLIGPGGVIISRGETPAQIDRRLARELNR